MYTANIQDQAFGLKHNQKYAIQFDKYGLAFIWCLAGMAYLTDNWEYIAYTK